MIRGGKVIELTPREFDLLIQLLRNAGRIVSRETLAREVWQETRRATPLDNVIDVHIARLRRKIDGGNSCRLIHTVRGVRFCTEGRSHWMRQWWQRRSLRLRLTVWYALTSACILLVLCGMLLLVLYQRLVSELDRQLRVDFETVESRVVRDDSTGDLTWPGYGHRR